MPPEPISFAPIRPQVSRERLSEILRPILPPPETPCDVAGELARLELPAEGAPELGPARLRVAAVGGGEIVLGGWITPAHVVHTDRARAVATGNACTLTVHEHLHLDRVVVSLESTLTDPAVRRALGELIRQGYTGARDTVFRRALRESLIDSGARPTQLDLPLAEGHVDITSRSGVVQVGDRSRLDVETPVFVRETVLPGAELLARDGSLRKGFVAALRAPDPEGRQTATFLRALMRAAGCTDQLRLVEHAAASGAHDASVFGLFSFTGVRNAGAVLAGAGNTLVRGVEVDVRQFRDEDLARTMRRLRADFPVPRLPARLRVPRPTETGLAAVRPPPATPPSLPPATPPSSSPATPPSSSPPPLPLRRRKRRRPGPPDSGEPR